MAHTLNPFLARASTLVPIPNQVCAAFGDPEAFALDDEGNDFVVRTRAWTLASDYGPLMVKVVASR